MKRAAAILTGPSTHLDHLGVLSYFLNLPLIVTEEETYLLAKKFYPFFNTQLHDWSNLTLDFLAKEYDLIFESGKFWALELIPLFELLFKKKMRFFYCPHGNSDKGRSLTPRDMHPLQNFYLIYGDQMLDQLKKTGALSNIGATIRTGNYRLPFYQKYKIFYNELVEQLIFSRFQNNNRSLFYAPSWQDRENPSSFFTAPQTLLTQLPEEFNLVIKWHPFLLRDEPGRVAAFEAQFENHPRISFISHFPAIYPILAHVDAYLGDYSSIGYDFLAFDKPLIFLTKEKDLSSPLQTAGVSLAPDTKYFYRSLEKILSMEQKRESEKRCALYKYAFGEAVDFNQIKKAISALNKDSP